MKFILGKKIGMSQMFENDEVVPVTLVEAGPVFITQIKDEEKDGYKAVQVGFDKKKDKNVSKAVKNHLKDLDTFRHLKEFRTEEEYKRGDKIDISIFETGQFVKVSGISKGKGFQGVVKRHGFAGGPKTHGQKHSHRAPGSIGATGPQRVMKGKKMAGRMGGDRITLKKSKIISVDPEQNLLVLKGQVPGRKNTLLEIRA